MVHTLFELIAVDRWLFFLLFLGSLGLVMEIGRWIGRMRRGSIGQGSDEGAALVVGSLLGLLAFVLALNLSNASGRHDMRMNATLEEVSAIGTAMQQAQAIGAPQSEAIANTLKEYTLLRYLYVRAKPSDTEIQKITDETNRLQAQMWDQMTTLIREQPTPPVTSLMNALNATFDATTAMQMAMEYRMPAQVVYLLLVMSLMGTGAVGYQFGLTQRKGRIPGVVLSILWAAVITQIIDIGTARIWTFRTETKLYEWSLDSLEMSYPKNQN
jgi:hypothetical protein